MCVGERVGELIVAYTHHDTMQESRTCLAVLGLLMQDFLSEVTYTSEEVDVEILLWSRPRTTEH